jgi:acetyl esterase/lipase
MAHEVAAALSWTLENIARYGGDPRRVTISGHSAGSHLMALAVMDPRFLAAYGHQWTEVSGMLGISGIYDVQAWYDFDRERGASIVPELPEIMGGPAGFGKASPINYARADLPPILLIHGDHDAIVPWNSSAEFHTALRQAGAHSELQVYVGAGHNDILLQAAEEEQAPIVVDIVRFCRDACGTITH